MPSKTELLDSARKFLETRSELYNVVTSSPEFLASGAQLYPYDIIGANFSIIIDLLEKTDFSDFLSENRIGTVLDVGGANGDLAFVFAGAGFDGVCANGTAVGESARLIAVKAAMGRRNRLTPGGRTLPPRIPGRGCPLAG